MIVDIRTVQRKADPAPLSRVDAASFREMMASVCAPVTVITTLADDGPRGTTVSAFASLSLEPPMVVFALDRSSRLLASLTVGSPIGVNLLALDQREVAMAFASRTADKFRSVGWAVDHGVPRIVGDAGWLTGSVARLVEGGDHLLVLVSVRHVEVAESAPLAYARRRFGTHSALVPEPAPVRLQAVWT